MSRICGLASLLLFTAACRLPPDRTPLQPLPEDGQVFTYEEILLRARAQASVALEAYFIDSWAELTSAARGLEQSARLMPKTMEVPANVRGKVADESAVLRKEAERLVKAAAAKDQSAANAALQRINLHIRHLRPEPTPEPPKDKKPAK